MGSYGFGGRLPLPLSQGRGPLARARPVGEGVAAIVGGVGEEAGAIADAGVEAAVGAARQRSRTPRLRRKRRSFAAEMGVSASVEEVAVVG